MQTLNLNKSFLLIPASVCVCLRVSACIAITEHNSITHWTVSCWTGVPRPPPRVAGAARNSFHQSLPASVSFCKTRPACRDFGPQHNSLHPWSLFTFPSQEKPNLCDTRLLMFLRSTCQSRGELSGSGSVNWALIRCCSN